jgi:hypothetical protein
VGDQHRRRRRPHRATDHLIVKGILGRRFDWGHHSGNYVIQGTGVGGNAVGGGTPTASYENDAGFTFIPVDDATNAQLLLKPVPPETFYILYQQGWRVDQLMRLMIDRIEISWPRAGGGCTVETIRNLPPPAYSHAIAPDPDSLSDYVTFLRVSAVAYSLQKHGYLLLQGTNSFVPYDPKSSLDVVAPTAGAPARQSDPSSPGATEIAKAASAAQSWELINNQWVLGQLVPGAKFVLNPPPPPQSGAPQPPSSVIDAIRQELMASNELNELKQGTALTQTLTALNQGFSIEGGQASQAPAAGASGAQQCEPPHLLMRSLLGLMSAAAQEQTSFDALMASNQPVPQSRWDTDHGYTPMIFAQEVPKIEQIPTLRILWTAADKGTVALARADYSGKQYYIADSREPLVPENTYWNRDMFRLLTQLQSQVTIDISKFPLPAVLQLNTQ